MSIVRLCPSPREDQSAIHNEVLPRDGAAQGLAKNSTVSANSSGVVTERRGVEPAMNSKTASGVAALASVLRRSPETMFTVIPSGPNSTAAVRVRERRAPLEAV